MTSFLFIFLLFSPTCLAETQNTCVNYYDSYSYTYATSNSSSYYLSNDVINCSDKCDNNTLCEGFNYNFDNDSINCQILFDIIDTFYSPNEFFYKKSNWKCIDDSALLILILFGIFVFCMLICYFIQSGKTSYGERHAGYQSIQ